jgi:hypothetical protein
MAHGFWGANLKILGIRKRAKPALALRLQVTICENLKTYQVFFPHFISNRSAPSVRLTKSSITHEAAYIPAISYFAAGYHASGGRRPRFTNLAGIWATRAIESEDGGSAEQHRTPRAGDCRIAPPLAGSTAASATVRFSPRRIGGLRNREGLPATSRRFLCRIERS